MAELANGDYLTLSAAAKIAPGRPHPATIWRWCRRGTKVRGTNRRIHLRHVRAGGKVFTKREWLEAFMAELATADLQKFKQDTQAPAPVLNFPSTERTPEQRQAAAEAARARMFSSKESSMSPVKDSPKC